MSKEDPKKPEVEAPKAPEKAWFKVPAELAPGVYRDGVGLFKPGQKFSLPDAASVDDEVPSLKLEPLNEAAVAMLQKTKANRERNAREALVKQPRPVPDVKPLPGAKKEEKPPKEQGKGLGVRAADR